MAQGYNGWAPVSARLHCGEGNFADVIKVSTQKGDYSGWVCPNQASLFKEGLEVRDSPASLEETGH